MAKTKSLVNIKAYAFSIRIVKLYQYLVVEKKEWVLAKQLLRSGTAIGALIEEAIGGESDADFKHKLKIGYKEARETHYWIRSLRDTDFLTENESLSILNDCEELIKMLTSITNTMNQKTMTINS